MVSSQTVLREVMTKAGVSQSWLARVSGLKQPSISQFLSGKAPMSDRMLRRLLACMGYQLKVLRQPVPMQWGRIARRSWALHCQLATHLTAKTLASWQPRITHNLQLLRQRIQGEPHTRNLTRWEHLVTQRDLLGIRLAMTGLDTDAIEMREVSPLTGLLPQAERDAVLKALT